MKSKRYYLPLLLVGFLLMASAWKPLANNRGNSPEERGKQIYTKGTSPSGGKIVAIMSGANVPGSVMPCANCHGADGKGKPEGGVKPSNLTWEQLTLPYNNGVNGREHPPYDEKSLVKAIAMSLDPAGNKLHSAMPRYQMNQADMSDLIAYLKVLGKDRDLGVLEDELKLGILLPDYPEKAGAMFGVLQAYLGQLNDVGGLYGRKLSLYGHVLDPVHLEDSLRAFVGRHEIFAFIGSQLPLPDRGLVELLNRMEIPVVGAVAGDPPTRILENREVFYLFPGTAALGKSLLDLSLDSLKLEAGQVAILHQDVSRVRKIAASLNAHSRKIGLEKAEEVSLTGKPIPEVLAALQRGGKEAIVWLGSQAQTADFLNSLEALKWYPHILVPSEFAGPDFLELPPVFENRVLIGYPTWFTALDPKMAKSFQEFSHQNQLSPRFRQSQMAVLAAGIVVSEVLRTAGRDLSRDKVKTELEKFHGMETGLVPSLTFGVNRRVGSSRVFIVAPEPGKGSLKLIQERIR